MFNKTDPRGYRQLVEKISMKPLIHGDNTLMCEFRLEQGAQLPRHSHPHEQTGYLISGRMDLTIGDQEFTAQTGDSWCISGGTEHQAVVLENTLVVEVFSPVRDDYLSEPE